MSDIQRPFQVLCQHWTLGEILPAEIRWSTTNLQNLPSRCDFSRPPKPIDEMCGYATENNRDDNDADGDDYTESFYVITALRKATHLPHVMKCMPTWTLLALTSLVYMTSNNKLTQVHQATHCLYALPSRCMEKYCDRK